MVNTIVGIDPGLKGSMAFLKTDGSLTVERLPILVEQRKTRRVRMIDTQRLTEILKEHGTDVALVEDVFSRPRDGVRGAFTFGGVKTAIVAALRAAGVRTLYVSPSVWKGRMRLSADKKRSRALAEKVFPKFKFKSIDDCEAALLAAYLLLHRADEITPDT
jgi:crossover junction endodeoxyribonuclease RuvC